MGNSSSTTTPGDGIPFVSWKTPLHDTTKSPRTLGRTQRSESLASHTSLTALVSGGVTTYHFAEASCYKYDKCSRLVTAPIVFTNPPKADEELRNAHDLVGSIAIVERGGRVHFPDIIRRIKSAGAIGCIFLERMGISSTTLATITEPDSQPSLYDGFHSSGRQSVAIPIVLLSKYHADQLLCDKPSRVSIEFLSNEQAIQHIVPVDDVTVIASAARAGEVEVLKHVLYSDTTGSIRERLPKATALCDAAEHGHVDCIELLHGFGISLDEQKPNGTTALMMACSVGNVEAARALLMFGAHVDLEDVHGLTAVMIAVRDGHVPCLKLLIRKQAQINLSRNRNRGTTALHIAARGGKEECVSILIEAGAVLDIQSPNYTTALMEAARAGNLGCVQLLVHAGASLDAKDREGQTAEDLARTFGHTTIEDFLREQAESDSVKDHRRKIEETIANPCSTLRTLLSLAMDHHIPMDVLQREMTREVKYMIWLEQPRIIYEVFQLLTRPNTFTKQKDVQYGEYQVQHFCCEIARWYSRRIFQKHTTIPLNVPPLSNHHEFIFGETGDDSDLDPTISYGYFKVFFHFLCTSQALDEVLLILFCKVMYHMILTLHLGPMILGFLATDGQSIVPWLVTHIGLDSIRDIIVWLLYSDMSDAGQVHIRTSTILETMFGRLYAWQRTLSWGIGTSYQRDAIENICLIINYIIYPPAVYVMGDVATFVDNIDYSLPLITDQYPRTRHNEVLKTLLLCARTSELSFGILIDLGFAEVFRQATHRDIEWIVVEGGTLSIAMMIMSTLGYHKRQRDVTGIESILKEVKMKILQDLKPRVAKFVQLCHALVEKDQDMLSTLLPTCYSLTIHTKGSALLTIITFLKRCTFLQDPMINQILAQYGMMSSLLRCFATHPTNNLLHHELTDIIRFVLLDPDQKRLPTCPLLHSLFQSPANVLDFVTKSYDGHVQYKGHLTTIANSIFTLTNTPVCRRDECELTCQEMVSQYTMNHTNWKTFEVILASQNRLEMQPLGQRHAPLCDGCLKLKHHALEFVSTTLLGDIKFTGYLETIFSITASHYCKVKTTEDFITGFLYKKDKIHDHIPIPEPTRVSSFIQFPVPMPFHALTFTLTYFGLCRQCDKLWYCDTLQSPNWPTRMKWVIPTSVRKWYSFGIAQGPNSGAHGIQFSTKGYKNFIVLTDTWGRQEKWMRAMDEAIIGSQATKRMDPANAMAIQIDNEIEPSEFEFKANTQMKSKDKKIRVRSRTLSASQTEMDHDSSSDEENDDGMKREIKSNPGLRIATESALKTGKPLPITTIRSPNSIRRSESAKTTIDRKQFQQDTKRYTEILANLKKSALARDANKNCTLAQSPISTTTSLRKLIPSASSHELSSLVTLNGPSHSPIQVEPKTNRMRHITSTRDLASMTDNA